MSSTPSPVSADEEVYRSLLLPSYALSLCVSTAALISLVFTLWIFLRRHGTTAGARGMVLLIITGLFTAMSLTVLHVVNIDGLASGASGSSGWALQAFMEAQYVITNTSLLLRNWWVTFLTLVRFVVIMFPLRVPEMLTRRRQLVAFFAILTASAAFSIVRHLEEKSCSPHPTGGGGDFSWNSTTTATAASVPAVDDSAAVDPSCESFIFFFFVMQTGIPVPAVLVLSVALAVHLCAAREPSDEPAPRTATNGRSESVASSSNALTSSAVAVSVLAAVRPQQRHHQHHKGRRPVESRGRCRKRKATRILLALAATFTVLELPTFIYFILMHFFPHFRCASPDKARLIFSGLNALVTLDTLANFFIFFVFSESFKREVKRFACRGAWRKCGGGGGGGDGVGGGGGGGVIGNRRPEVSSSNGACAGGAWSPELRPLRTSAAARD